MFHNHSLRERTHIIALLLAVSLVILSPPSQAQETPDDEWGKGADVLNRTPPRVMASSGEAADFRPPVEPPGGFQGRKANTAQSQAGVPTGRVAAGAPSTMATSGFYVVQAGDNAPKIAQKALGNPNRWRELMEFNQIRDSNMLRVGLRLRLPTGNAVASVGSRPMLAAAMTSDGRRSAQAQGSARGSAPVIYPQASAGEPQSAVHSPVRAPKVAAPPQDYETVEPENGADRKAPAGKNSVEADASYYGQAGGSYVIQRGDTMGKISKKLLGSSKRWREISRANPQLNPNKLTVGMAITIPGMGVDPSMGQSQMGQSPVMMPQNAMAAGVPQGYDQQVGGASFDANGGSPGMAPPSYDPPPMVPPPALGYGGAPAYGGVPSANAPFPSAGAMPPGFEPPSPYVSAPMPAPLGAVPAPVTTALYREERYRIPDELKPTDYSPYFGNFNGVHGLFETESALIPYMKTWHFGLHFRYDKYKYLNGNESVVDGRQWVVPINLLYTGKKLFASLVVPFQSWDVTAAGANAPTVSLTGAADPEVKVGYQIWKNYEGEHAVTLHVGGRFPTDNYHQPLVTLTGKTRTGVKIGPANATRGAWAEFGGAYSGKLNDRWASHLNLALANDSDDGISRYTYRGMVDYRVNHHYSLVAQVDGATWMMDSAKDGANVDLLLGMALFNETWQGVLGFPMGLQSHWGYGHDFGVTFGLNTRWD